MYNNDWKVIKNYDKLNDFVKDLYLRKILNEIVGLLISNPIIIKVNSDVKLFKDKEVIYEFQRMLKKLIDNMLPTLCVFGVVSFNIRKDDFSIDVINYKNGNLKYKVDEKKKVTDLGWFWDIKTIAYNHTNKEDKNVKHFVWSPVSFDGHVTSPMYNFLPKREQLKAVENVVINLEKQKLNPAYYLQRKIPDLVPEKYSTFQDHTLFTNANVNQLDDEKKRFYNMHGIRNTIEIYENNWKERTSELILKYFQMRRFFMFERVNYKGSLIYTAGELVEPKFFPVQKHGTLYKDLLNEYKLLLNSFFEMDSFSNENRSKLKDEMRLNMFFLRSIISKFQIMVEDCLAFVLNECYADLLDYLNEGSENDIGKIRVELDPLQLITSEEIDLFNEKGVPLKKIIKVILGQEFEYLAQDLETTDLETTDVEMKEKKTKEKKKKEKKKKEKKKKKDEGEGDEEEEEKKKKKKKKKNKDEEEGKKKKKKEK